MGNEGAEETPAPAAAPADAPPAGDAPAADAEAKPEEAEPPPPQNPEHAGEKRLVCKHWVRPKFFQYKYLYDYQRNYYDDLITYLDKRNHGIPVERPTPQTWGERALRTYMSRNYSYASKKYSTDTSLLYHISVGAKFQRTHTKSLISRKYSKLGITSSEHRLLRGDAENLLFQLLRDKNNPAFKAISKLYLTPTVDQFGHTDEDYLDK